MCASLLFQLEAFCASAVTVSTCSVPIVNFIEFDASPFTGVEYVLTTRDIEFDVESLFDELVTSVEDNPLGLVTNRRVWASSIVLEDCKSSFSKYMYNVPRTCCLRSLECCLHVEKKIPLLMVL